MEVVIAGLPQKGQPSERSAQRDRRRGAEMPTTTQAVRSLSGSPTLTLKSMNTPWLVFVTGMLDY